MSPSFWGSCPCVVGMCLCHEMLMSVCALVTISRVYYVKWITERSAVRVVPSCDAGEFPCAGSSVLVCTVRATVVVDTVSNDAFRLRSKQAAAQRSAAQWKATGLSGLICITWLSHSFCSVWMIATVQPFPAQCHTSAVRRRHCQIFIKIMGLKGFCECWQ